MVGRVCFALAIAFFGFQHLQHGQFVTRVMAPWPPSLPGAAFWPYVIGALLIIEALALFSPRSARTAALILAGQTFLGAFLLALPTAVTHTRWGGEWTMAGKAFALAGGALVVASSVSEKTSPRFLVVGKICLGGFMILGGIQHFIWAQFVATLVPTWIPAPLLWVYFAGVALIAGGLGMMIPTTARLAAALSALMIFLWVILLHIPRAWANLHDANEATAVFEALAFSGIALLLSLASRGSTTK